MPKRVIASGFIGAGGIGSCELEALLRVEGARIVAVCEATEELTTSFAERYGIAKMYTDYRQLIDDPEVEVVHITTPNYLHYGQAKYALEAGKHVVCEKPLGVNWIETRDLLDIARENRLVNAVCFNHRYFPQVFHAREMIRNRELGEVGLVRGLGIEDYMLFIPPGHWRLDSRLAGSSKTWATYGAHCFDLVEFVTGLKVREVIGDFGYVHPGSDPGPGIQLEDHANVLLRFENGARGAITLSEAAPGHKGELFFDVSGTRGSVSWSLEHPNELWIGRSDRASNSLLKYPGFMGPEAQGICGTPNWVADGLNDSFKQLFAKVYGYIREEGYRTGLQTPFPTFEDGHRLELILKAILESVREERWVKVAQE